MSASPPPRPVVLASGSKSRANLLRAAGVPFDIVPAQVDEEAIKSAVKAEGQSASHCAEVLAEFKAITVADRYPETLVIAADQMLECEGAWFDKPADMAGARAHLTALRGKTHTLPTAVAVALNGAAIWHHTATPRLSMRAFSERFLDGYLAAAGPAILSSVGAYQLEAHGAQLFTRVEGDFFTILGLPLLELLAFLREHGVGQT